MSADTAEQVLPFISYAQNFEDVILWRALKHIPSGFYVDVGAQDPIIDSVSMAFYENGWRGIHIEPNSYYAKKIREARPDEQVIEAAISLKEGRIPFFNVGGAGLTTADIEIAQKHQQNGFEVQLVDVPCMRLSEVFDNLSVKDVHWLKIDAEGLEKEVLASWEPSPVRPWVVVIESVEPSSPVSNFQQWEDILINFGYEFVYFDGLNRFYISHEHPELREFFGVGANVFDNFFLSDLSPGPFGQKLADKLRECRHLAEHQQQEAEIHYALINAEKIEVEKSRLQIIAEKKEVERLLLNVERRLLDTELRIEQIYSSRSWRITKPIRAVTIILRWLCKGSYAWLTLKPGSRPRRIAGRCLRKVLNQIRKHPHLKAFLILQLRRFPWLDNKLRAFVWRSRMQVPPPPPQTTVVDIGLYAGKIYNRIYAAKHSAAVRREEN